MPTRISEYASSQNAALTVAAGLVKGVKILGLQSANGRRYTPEAIRRAVTKYEDVRVNIDHAKRPGDPRSYSERFGRLSNVRVESDGLYGDLAYNPKHPQAEQFDWDAKNSPSSVGLSHVVDASIKRVNGAQQVESIDKVHSVDIVADPATVSGLFEQLDPEGGDTMPETITIQTLKDRGVYTLIREEIAAELAVDGEAAKLKEQVTAVTAERDALLAAGKLAERKDVVLAAIKEAKLPEALVTDLLVEQCVAADDAGFAAIIEERTGFAKLIGGGRPTGGPKSKEQHQPSDSGLTWETMDAKQYAAAITE